MLNLNRGNMTEKGNPYDDEALSIKEFATKLKVHPNTIRGLLKTGKIHGYRIGRVWRINLSEILRLAEIQFSDVIDKLVEKKVKERLNGK
jgi:excisionase family DNA binding protein